MITIHFSLMNSNGHWDVDSFKVASRELAQAWVDQMKSAFGVAFVASF